MKWDGLSGHVLLFVTPWTIVCQTSLSMEFSRLEYDIEFSFIFEILYENRELQLNIQVFQNISEFGNMRTDTQMADLKNS